MLQAKYPSLINTSNFLSIPQFESQFIDQPIDIDNLYKLINLLEDDLTTYDDTNTSSNIYEIRYYKSRLQLYLNISSYCKLIILSPNLSNFNLSLIDIYKIWEIRINCLLMSVNLKIPNSKSILPIITNTNYLRNEINPLIKNLTKLGSTDNNNKELFPNDINWSFKIILNRIKYGSSLLLVNYLYNELIQLRSNYNNSSIDKELISKQIIIILFNISSIMIARQEYLTIINLLNQTKTIQNSYNLSQIQLLNILIITIYIFKSDNNNSNDDEFKSHLMYPILLKTYESFISNEDDSNKCIKQLIKVLNNIEPIYNDKDSIPLSLTIDYKLTLNEIIELVQDLKITGRILCCLCGVYEIEMNNSIQDKEKEKGDNNKLNESLNIINNEWFVNINNLYAFE
ncbi:hypothetical protein CANARDRAFT_8667 [[Candida] arabinofermentans NRRL YB-2248]|uniref:Uncharacterized protein n=1 Tax=[Candida] arabinofermentans NRRL YB-2248 TaxID=983967 RepID=A0A1E4SXT9_9ASCO|nr:hypothetical protein CANARDRAFT_8667 [[Candida] arabinofermentans NRRL YB-2248]